MSELPDLQRAADIEGTAVRRTTVISLGIALAVGLVALFTPLRVLSLGFLPPDDALSHCAKVASGKSWDEIMVRCPGIVLDSHPGWHAILGGVMRLTGWDVEALVMFSVVFLFFFLVVMPSFFSTSAELWLLSLLTACVVSPMLAWRLMLGRPYILSMTVVFCYLFAFRGPHTVPSRKAGVGLILLTALATWAHVTWYMYAFLVAAVGLTCGLRSLARVCAWLAAGVAIGACATGHPVIYLVQTVRHVIMVFHSADVSRQLVFELQPVRPDSLPPVVAALLLLAGQVQGFRAAERMRTPAFVVFVAGWALAFVSSRFWYDWGLPAFAVWTALTAEPLLARMSLRPPARVVIAFLSAAALFLAISSDVDSRWSRHAQPPHLDARNPAHAAWLPEPGGILYSEAMTVYFDTFYANPKGAWRYALGCESGWMLPEDLRTFRKIQVTQSFSAFQPWVDKMTSRDRLVIRHVSATAPGIPELEWGCPVPNLWVGRKKTGP